MTGFFDFYDKLGHHRLLHTHSVLKIFADKSTKSETIYFLTVFKDSVGTNWLEAECDRQAREVSKC